MDWVKLPTDYWSAMRDLDDAAEVMFLRGLALAAEIKLDGYLPDAYLPHMTRRWRRVRKDVAQLVAAGLWEPVDGGHRIVGWETYARPRYRQYIPLAVRLAVYERDGHACVFCGATEPLSLDHIFPWSLGGSDEPENLQTLCIPCNMRKGARV